jgi:hypothetical protein
MIRAKIDQMLDRLPEDELLQAYYLVEDVQNRYLFKKNLLDKGVVISDLFEDRKEITENWDNTFARNVSAEVKASIYYEQFRWHMFSYQKQSCLMEEAAREAFDALEKDEFYVMYQNAPEVFLFSQAQKVVAADFDLKQDIYLFDTAFRWTYVHTHEFTCGPYFYQINGR